MATPTPTRLRRPAYAKILDGAIGRPASEISVEVHIGKTAWNRVRRVMVNVFGSEESDTKRIVGWRPEGTHFGRYGIALVVHLDAQTTITDYDFTCLDRLCVLLVARDCSYQIACDCARRMCEHGAAKVLLFHPQADPGDPKYRGWDVYTGAPR